MNQNRESVQRKSGDSMNVYLKSKEVRRYAWTKASLNHQEADGLSMSAIITKDELVRVCCVGLEMLRIESL